jgi:hypothetical protein
MEGSEPPQSGERSRGSMYARVQELVVYGKGDRTARKKVLTDAGWDAKVRLSDWLDTLSDDALVEVVVAVEALEPQEAGGNP